jgi:hypothetical protein
MKCSLLGAAALAALMIGTSGQFAAAGPNRGGFAGGFSHGGFGHSALGGGFGHSAMMRTSFRHSGSLRQNAVSRHLTSHHSSHHGLPAGFSHGNASWKQHGGTPPGWSKGKKKGWGCTPGSSGCMPPGLQ